jgi:hypothetical protein
VLQQSLHPLHRLFLLNLSSYSDYACSIGVQIDNMLVTNDIRGAAKLFDAFPAPANYVFADPAMLFEWSAFPGASWDSPERPHLLMDWKAPFDWVEAMASSTAFPHSRGRVHSSG